MAPRFRGVWKWAHGSLENRVMSPVLPALPWPAGSRAELEAQVGYLDPMVCLLDLQHGEAKGAREAEGSQQSRALAGESAALWAGWCSGKGPAGRVVRARALLGHQPGCSALRPLRLWP